MILKLFSSAIDKGNLFNGVFSGNSNLDDSGISLPAFPLRTNMKVHIPVTQKMVKKILSDLHSAKILGSDCFHVVILKNYEPELSYLLGELFNMCLKESCSLDCRKIPLVVDVFNNAGESSKTKNYCPVSFCL